MIKEIAYNVKSISFPNFGSIVYLIQLPKQNILIDTSSKENAKELVLSLKELKINPDKINTIILTHPHFDHLENINLFTRAKIYGNFKQTINRDYSRTPIKKITQIDKLPSEKFEGFKIYKTPGHTSEDIIILYNAKDKTILFSGDLIFHNGYIGRTDFPESRPEEMQKSLDLVKSLKFDILCPGH